MTTHAPRNDSLTTDSTQREGILLSRRTLFSSVAAIGALHLIGASSVGRTLTLAYADDGGQTHFSVYVLSREEIPVLALNVSQGQNTPVPGMQITFTSCSNGKTVTATTDEAGAAVANVRALCENADEELATNYAGWVRVTGEKSGYRTFTETSRLIQTALPADDQGRLPNVVQVPTQPTDGSPYFSCLCLDGVDVQYLPQSVGLVAEDDSTHYLDLTLENADAPAGSGDTWDFVLYGDDTPLAPALSAAISGSTVTARISGQWLDGAHGIAEGTTVSLAFSSARKIYSGQFKLPLTFHATRLAIPSGFDDGRALWIGDPEPRDKDDKEPPSTNTFAWFVQKEDTFNLGIPGVPIQLFSDRNGNFGASATLASCTFFKTKNNEFIKVDPDERWKTFSDMSGSGWLEKFSDEFSDNIENWMDATISPDGDLKNFGWSKLTKSLNVALSFEAQVLGSISDTSADVWLWHANAGGIVKFNVAMTFSQQLFLVGIPAFWTFDFNGSALFKFLIGMRFEDGFHNIAMDHENRSGSKWPYSSTFILTAEAGLGVGIGVVGICSASVRGYGSFTAMLCLDGDTAVDPTHTFPHYQIVLQGNIEVCVQLLLFKKSITITKTPPITICDNWAKKSALGATVGTGTLPDARFGTTAALTAGVDPGMEMVLESDLSDAVEFAGAVTTEGTTPSLLFSREALSPDLDAAAIRDPYAGAPTVAGRRSDSSLNCDFGLNQGGYNPLRGVRPTIQKLLWTDAFSAPRARTVQVGGVTYLLRLAIVEVEVPTTDANLKVVRGSNGCLFAQARLGHALPQVTLGDDGSLVYPDYECDLPVAQFDDFAGTTTGDLQSANRLSSETLVAKLTGTEDSLELSNETSILRSRLVISALNGTSWSAPQVIDFAMPTTTRSTLRINIWDVDFDVVTADSGQLYVALCSIVRPTESTDYAEQFKSQFVTIMRVDPRAMAAKEVRTNIQSCLNEDICWHPRLCVHQTTISPKTFDELTLLYYHQNNKSEASLRHMSWLVDLENGAWTIDNANTKATFSSEFVQKHLTEGTFDVRSASLNGIQDEVLAIAWSCPAINEDAAAGVEAHGARSVTWAADQYYVSELSGTAYELEDVDHLCWGATTVSDHVMHTSWLYSVAGSVGGERLLRRLKMDATATKMSFQEQWPVGHLRTGLQFFTNADGTRLYAARAMEGTVPALPEDFAAVADAGYPLMGTVGRYNSPAVAFESGTTGEQTVQNYQLLCAYYDAANDTYYDFFPMADLDFCPDTLLCAYGRQSDRYDFVAGTITDADRNLLDVYHISVPQVRGLQLEGTRCPAPFAMPGEKCRLTVEVSNTGNAPINGFTVVITDDDTKNTIDQVVLTDLAAAVQPTEDTWRPVYDESGLPLDELADAEDVHDASGLLWPGKTRQYALAFTVPTSATTGNWALLATVADPVSSSVSLQAAGFDLNASDTLIECLDPRARTLSVSVGGTGYAETALTAANYQVNGSTPVETIFRDVNAGRWYTDSIQKVYDRGIMTGDADAEGISTGYFGTSDYLTRAQAASVLYRMVGEPSALVTSAFSDVPVDAWYAQAVCWAAAHGVVHGYGGTTLFGPDDRVTREQLAVMLHNMSVHGLIDVSSTYSSDALDRFPDAGSVANWAKESLQWAVTQGIIHGVSGIYLDPKGYSSRAAMAVMVANILG